MKIPGIFLGVLLSVAFWQFSQTRESLTRIKADLIQDRAVLQVRIALLEKMRAHPVKPLDKEQMRQLEQERRELIRLRGEYTRYRSTKGKTTEELEREIAKTKARADAVWAESGLMFKMDRAKKERKAEQVVIEILHRLVSVFQQEHQQTPESIETVIEWIESLPQHSVERSMLENISVTNEFRHLTWENCELFDTGITKPGGQALRVLREKVPRCLPDDSVSRFYMLESGSFKEFITPFQEFREKEAAFLSDLPD